MSSEHPGSPDEVPGRHVSVSQIVGYNMARWRKAAGITQKELGDRLGGWSGATVSAAEKSWDGKRVRKFSADDIVAIATVLGVPAAAMFLPPEDDGAAIRYLYHIHERGAHCSDMREMFSLLLPESAGSGAADDAWQKAFTAAASRYLDPDVGADIIAYLEDMTGAERRAERLARIRGHRAAMLALVADLDQITLAIETEGRE